MQQIPSDKVDLRQLGISEAQRQLTSGNVYGAVIIPSDFTKRLGIFATTALTRANESVGKQLIQTVQTQLQSAGGAPAPDLAGLSKLMLAKPIDVVVTPFRPLPAAGVDRH